MCNAAAHRLPTHHNNRIPYADATGFQPNCSWINIIIIIIIIIKILPETCWADLIDQ